MKLTRNVLIEKQSEFCKYQHPDDVPDILWTKAFNKLKQMKSTKEFCEFLMGKILCPLLNQEDYHIGNRISHDKYISYRDLSSNIKQSGDKYKMRLLMSSIKRVHSSNNPDDFFKGLVVVFWEGFYFNK